MSFLSRLFKNNSLQLQHLPNIRIACLCLATVMAYTRLGHIESIAAPPDASWAVFIAAGFYLSGWLFFAGFFLLAVAVDWLTIGWGDLSSACINGGYLFLLPSYAILWMAGRLCRQRLLQGTGPATPLLVILSAICACFIVSNAGYWLFDSYASTLSIIAYVKATAPWIAVFITTTLVWLTFMAACHLLWYKVFRDAPQSARSHRK